MDTDKTIMLPSGIRLTMNDPTGELEACFQQLFGSETTGLAFVVNTAVKNRRNDIADKQYDLHQRPTVKSQRTGRKSRQG